MVASVMDLLEKLEAQVARATTELQTLREENARLKQQASWGNTQEDARASDTESAPGVPTADAPIKNVFFDPIDSDTTYTEKRIGQQVSMEFEGSGSASPPSPQALLKQWYQRYPNAFFKGHTKPLKVGIHHDLAQREPWPGKLIRRALANYVNLPRYIKSMREGAHRVDLDGQPVDVVGKEAAVHANQRRKIEDQPSKSHTANESRAATKQKAHYDHRRAPKETQVSETQAHSDKKSREANPNELLAINDKGVRKKMSWEERIQGLQQKFSGR